MTNAAIVLTVDSIDLSLRHLGLLGVILPAASGEGSIFVAHRAADVDMDTSLPATDQIVHFGGGQTQVTKELPSGTHTLRLLLGDLNHVPHDPPVMSEAITITVE